MNWFNLSFIGWVILVIALSLGAHLAGAPIIWIAIGALALIGIGMILSVKHAKPKM